MPKYAQALRPGNAYASSAPLGSATTLTPLPPELNEEPYADPSGLTPEEKAIIEKEIQQFIQLYNIHKDDVEILFDKGLRPSKVRNVQGTEELIEQVTTRGNFNIGDFLIFTKNKDSDTS